MSRKIMITGGLGFIGTNLVKYWAEKYPRDEIVIVDAETYAASLDALNDEWADNPRIHFERADIRDQVLVARLLQRHRPDGIFHLAAESHVCRSIAGPKDFMTTNIMGTWNLLEEWRHLYQQDFTKRFVHVSTDEVFGELEHHDAPFNEASPVRPRSPYAASKASSDLIALAYYETYGVPVIVTNCSNNFGPHQHAEKLIPATITRFLEGDPARLYGHGTQVRDWLYVRDHCAALDRLFIDGLNGQRYVIGGEKELTNLELVERVHASLVRMGVEVGAFHVEHDYYARPTDDERYAINNGSIRAHGWSPSTDFDRLLDLTVAWYVNRSPLARIAKTKKEAPAYAL